MRPLFLLIILLAAIPAHAAVYRGDIGGRTLTVSDAARAYFYKDERLPQPLTPSPDCASGATCYRSETGDILRLRDGSAWWNDIPLTPFAPATDPDNRLYAAELPFEAALLADITFAKSATTTVQNKTLQWYRDPESGLEHPLVASARRRSTPLPHAANALPPCPPTNATRCNTARPSPRP